MVALAVDEDGDLLPLAPDTFLGWKHRTWFMVAAVLFYFVIGQIFYTQHEEWSQLDALYFSVVTVTTVGFVCLATVVTATHARRCNCDACSPL